MLGKALAAMTDTELRRVIDAPVEGWKNGDYYDMHARTSCLIGHAGGCYVVGSQWEARELQSVAARVNSAVTAKPFYVVEERFDLLCLRFGVPRTVRAIKLRALAELEARTQREPATVGAA